MNRKSIVIIAIALHVIFNQGDEVIENVKENVRMDMLTKDFCEVSEFEDLNYYLLCDTRLHKDVTYWEHKTTIIGKETANIEDAKALHREFKMLLPLDDDEREETYVEYVSPDCQWIVTTYWKAESERKQTLFCEKKKVSEAVEKGMSIGNSSFLIVKKGDSYERMEQQNYDQYMELIGSMERYSNLMLNEEGTLIAGVKGFEQLHIRSIEENIILWSFPVQEIQNAVQKIRQEGYKSYVDVIQFRGNESEGSIIVQCGRSSFFEISYPEGEVKYLGEYLYSLCYSPDGKYAAYSCEDYDSGVDMEPEEQEKIAQGIYIMEIETGKIAYIYWDPFKNPDESWMETRSFMWIEKDSFDKYMGNDK